MSTRDAMVMLLALVMPVVAAAQPPGSGFRDIAELTIEELSSLTITSVARRPTRLDEAAASVYVITAEDIRRSGASTLPEILRLAPNLQVARTSRTGYAISARGFNNEIGNKLLVLIDGRIVYTPVYSGVFWEMQDTMIEDIARVEVISGPGATMWGTNAVNGVINVITRNAHATQGAVAKAEAGTVERGAAIRYGGALGETGAFRVYARTRKWDATAREANGAPALDAFERHQAGFRTDFGAADGRFTLQGDAFTGTTGHRGFVGQFEVPAHTIGGYNLLARWIRDGLRVQAYWDRIEREEIIIFQPKVDTFRVDLQHEFEAGAHRVVWGGGYRRSEDDVEPGVFSTFIPRSTTLEWKSLFAQTDILLRPALTATLGVRLEHNDFTGLEHLPTGRLAWRFADGQALWASASRAVRTPSRYDRHVFFPQEPPFIIAGGLGFVSEVARVYELGYRAQPAPTVSWSLTAFRHDWHSLRSGSGTTLPATLANNIDGRVQGVEGWGHWQVRPHWRLSGGFLHQDKDLWFRDGAEDTVGVDNPSLHNDPRYQFVVRSRMDLSERMELDLALRRVGRLRVQPLPAYTELDLRLGWRVSDTFDFALVGRDLLGSAHAEFGGPASRSEFERSVSLVARWRF